MSGCSSIIHRIWWYGLVLRTAYGVIDLIYATIGSGLSTNLIYSCSMTIACKVSVTGQHTTKFWLTVI